ncbi:hypothetical protein ACYJ3O_004505 [Vibrio parahaemolyticus]
MEFEYEPEKQPSLDALVDKIEFFKNEFGDNVALFSLRSAFTVSDALDLYNNFDQFVKDCEYQLSLAVDSSSAMNLINEIIHYFNIALDLLPALAGKTGDLINFLHGFFDNGGGGFFRGWTSYSIQFGMPGGISIAFNFPTD